jgi:hypothetical protein
MPDEEKPCEEVEAVVVETPKKKGRKMLTSGEHHFLEGKIANAARPWHQRKSDRQIAKDAGYSPNTSATTIKNQIVNKINANEDMQKRLATAGLGLDSIVEDIQKLRECTNDKGNPDNDVQFRVLDLRAKIQNIMPAQKIEVNQRKVVLNITPELADRVKRSFATRGVDVPIEITEGKE